MHDRQWEPVDEDTMKLRPVARRIWERRWTGDSHPPTEAERHDAILLLAEPYQDEVGDEAFRILDEYGQ